MNQINECLYVVFEEMWAQKLITQPTCEDK